MLTDLTHPNMVHAPRKRSDEVWLDVDAQRASHAYAKGATDLRARLDDIEAAALAVYSARPPRRVSAHVEAETPAAAAARWRRNAEWEATQCERMASTLAAGVGAAHMPASEVRAWLQCEAGERLARWLAGPRPLPKF